jgi:hypothetical protein
MSDEITEVEFRLPWHMKNHYCRHIVTISYYLLGVCGCGKSVM